MPSLEVVKRTRGKSQPCCSVQQQQRGLRIDTEGGSRGINPFVGVSPPCLLHPHYHTMEEDIRLVSTGGHQYQHHSHLQACSITHFKPGLFFGHSEKKLKTKKTQNSSTFSRKLKQNFRKTQKPPTQLELLQYKSCIFIPKMVPQAKFFSKSYTSITNFMTFKNP